MCCQTYKIHQESLLILSVELRLFSVGWAHVGGVWLFVLHDSDEGPLLWLALGNIQSVFLCQVKTDLQLSHINTPKGLQIRR